MEGILQMGMSFKTSEGRKSSRNWSALYHHGARNGRFRGFHAFGEAAGEILKNGAELFGIDGAIVLEPVLPKADDMGNGAHAFAQFQKHGRRGQQKVAK